MAVESRQARRRILFVAGRACGDPSLCAQVRAHATGAADVLVVAPVQDSTLPPHWTSDDSTDRTVAAERLHDTVSCLGRHDLRAHGALGDADPVQAIEDALHGFPAEEIVICREESEQTHWFRKITVERTKKRFPTIPVTEITIASRQPAGVA